MAGGEPGSAPASREGRGDIRLRRFRPPSLLIVVVPPRSLLYGSGADFFEFFEVRRPCAGISVLRVLYIKREIHAVEQ